MALTAQQQEAHLRAVIFYAEAAKKLERSLMFNEFALCGAVATVLIILCAVAADDFACRLTAPMTFIISIVSLWVSESYKARAEWLAEQGDRARGEAGEVGA